MRIRPWVDPHLRYLVGLEQACRGVGLETGWERDEHERFVLVVGRTDRRRGMRLICFEHVAEGVIVVETGHRHPTAVGVVPDPDYAGWVGTVQAVLARRRT